MMCKLFAFPRWGKGLEDPGLSPALLQYPLRAKQAEHPEKSLAKRSHTNASGAASAYAASVAANGSSSSYSAAKKRPGGQLDLKAAFDLAKQARG